MSSLPLSNVLGISHALGISHLLRLSTVLLIALLFSACATKPPKAYDMSFEIVANQDINPTAKGRPSPLAFMVYQLREQDPFLVADFETLFTEAEPNPLDAIIVNKKQYQIRPGKRAVTKLAVLPETRYIGIVAAFRGQDPKGKRNWVKVVELKPNKPKKAKRYQTTVVFSGQKIDLYRVKRGRLAIF